MGKSSIDNPDTGNIGHKTENEDIKKQPYNTENKTKSNTKPHKSMCSRGESSSYFL